MSDDDYYYDEYFEWEEEPYNAVDELAERTTHSPILIGYDPTPDFLDYDGEYDDSGADEYYDSTTKARRKRKRDPTVSEQKPGRKRKKLGPDKSIPALELEGTQSALQPVVWKSKKDVLKPLELPIFENNQAPPVALLRDWRERFKIEAMENRPASTRLRGRKKTQRSSRSKSTSAPVEDEIEAGNDMHPPEQPPELPPTTLSEGLATKQKKSPTTNHMNGTISNLAEQAALQASEADMELGEAEGDEVTFELDNEGIDNAMEKILENQRDMISAGDPSTQPDEADVGNRSDTSKANEAQKAPNGGGEKKKVGRPKGKRKAADSGEQPEAKKIATARGQNQAKSERAGSKVTRASTRQTRSKK